MLRDRWVVAGELDRPLQLLHRPSEVTAAEIHPTEAVDVEPVLGLELERPANEGLGLIEVDTHFGVGVAKVVERCRVLRIQLDGPLHLLNCARLVVGLIVGGAEREAIAVVVRKASNHALEECDRALQVLAFAVEGREVAHQLGVVRLLAESVLDLMHRVGQSPSLLEEVRLLNAGVHVVFRRGRDLHELVQRLVDLPSLGVGRAEVVADAPVVGLGRHDEVELGDGAIRVALLEVDQSDLGARFARIGIDLLELLELGKRVVETLLSDVQATQPTAHEGALRVQGEDLLIELDRLLRPAGQLVGKREIGQDQLGLRAELERLQVVVLRLVRLAGTRIHPAEIVVAKDRPRVLRDELLQRGDRPVGFTSLGVERAQVEVRVLALGVDAQQMLVRGGRLVVTPERRKHPAEQPERLRVVRLCGERELALLEGLREEARPDVESGQAHAQKRRTGIRGDRRLELAQRAFGIVARERHLATEEVPQSSRVRRQRLRLARGQLAT